ncbi:MAG: FUSC family protein, partial [Alphaproteobacteria bacterium]|nr:FUSC family protein [Alphaproteobacteria bacterium]
DARRRMDMLIVTMVHELRDMASAKNAPRRRRIWRSRLYCRLLRLVRWAEKTGEREFSAADAGLAVLAVGGAVHRMRELLQGPDIAPGMARPLETAIKRMRDLPTKPERVRRALERAARRLADGNRPDADLMKNAARDVAANISFFRRAAKDQRREDLSREPGGKG